MQNQTEQSILTLENQQKLTLTGVEGVDAFSDTAITLTVNKKKVVISGSGLKVLAFSQGSGNFSASGVVFNIKFGGIKGKGLQKLFK